MRDAPFAGGRGGSPAAAGRDAAARAAGAQEGEVPPLVNHPFLLWTAHDLLPQSSADRDRCENTGALREVGSRSGLGEKNFLDRCTRSPLGVRKGRLYCVRQTGGSRFMISAISPPVGGQGRCRTRGRRTRGGSSPSCESPPFCFGRRTLCCRKAPLIGIAAKIREPCGRPVRVVVRERRISWVGAPVLPLGCGKTGFVLFGKRVEAVL